MYLPESFEKGECSCVSPESLLDQFIRVVRKTYMMKISIRALNELTDVIHSGEASLYIRRTDKELNKYQDCRNRATGAVRWNTKEGNRKAGSQIRIC